VFGTVVEGLDVVTAVEKLGSGSGKTSARVTIADSGELPLGAAASNPAAAEL
jgi:cyclophilin family peptidyl-prolyl cis-trans isomerase